MNVMHQATGRRKTSVARVRLTEGSGKFLVNRRELSEYFPRQVHRILIELPLKAVDRLGRVDVHVNVKGGGLTGQAGAVRLGVARCLLAIDEDFRRILKSHGLLTRDSRKVERKKYGQPKARKRFQFSKR